MNWRARRSPRSWAIARACAGVDLVAGAGDDRLPSHLREDRRHRGHRRLLPRQGLAAVAVEVGLQVGESEIDDDPPLAARQIRPVAHLILEEAAGLVRVAQDGRRGRSVSAPRRSRGCAG